MAAGNIALSNGWATIEADDEKRLATISKAPRGSLVNVGDKSVFARMGRSADADLTRDGLQSVIEIEIKPNGTAPVRSGEKHVEYQCADTETSTLQWYPEIS